MENKSNSLNRIKRHQREKVLRFSIRKYSFGAASVAVAALMFLGAHAVSADVVDAKNQPAIGIANPNEEKSPLIESAPKSKNEETKEAEKVEVAKETKEREKTSENKEAVEDNSLNNGTSTSTITVTKDASGDKVTEKQTLDKSQLQASITKVQELLDKVNKEKAPASTLAAIQADLEEANSVLNNNSLELTQAEIDAVAKKLNEKIFVLSSMPKANVPEKVVKEGKNTIANTGSHDSRNGQKMGEGTQFRANTQINSGALANIKYFASVDPGQNNGRKTRNNEPELTLNKTEIKAVYVHDSEGKWIVYDVFFNNDGRKMTGLSQRQHYYFQAPYNIMDGSNTVKDLSFTRYKNINGTRLSNAFQGFQPYGNEAKISYAWGRKENIFHGDGRTFYDPNSGAYTDARKGEVFKHNQWDSDLNTIVRDENGNYPKKSYYLGLEVGPASTDYAVHMHAKIKLRDNVTLAEANQYGRVFAASVTSGETTNQSYIMGATGTRLTTKTDAQLNPIQGLTVTKTVGDTLGDPDDPANSGYVTHKESKPFPAGMKWSWEKGVKPASTATTAGVFKYKVIASYQDGTSSENPNSGSDGTVTLNVKPIKPTIPANEVAHKKGLTHQTITVNVGKGVKEGSKVNLYEDNKFIGTGKTTGTTARITVEGPLTGNQITAETIVNNHGTVKSDRSDPVRPTEAPDNLPPTATMDGLTLTNDINTTAKFVVFKGATFNPTIRVSDDKSNVTNLSVSGISNGTKIEKSGKWSKDGADVKVELGNATATNTATLGDHEGSVVVKDALNNTNTYKFKYTVVDVEVKETPKTVPLNTQLGDSHYNVKVVDIPNAAGNDKYYPAGMSFKWKKGTSEVANETKLAKPGVITDYKALVKFPKGEGFRKSIDGEEVRIYAPDTVERPVTFRVKPTAPTVTPQENGDVTVTPVNEKNVNSFNFTYNDPNNSSRKITATKTKDGWTLNNAPDDGVTIDKTTGKVTIKDRAIKDSAPITAKSETSDHVESNPATVNSKVGDKTPPKFEFTPDGKEIKVENNGEQVVYVTPTEETKLNIGKVTDDSNKLTEVRLSTKDNKIFSLGLGSGLSYNEVVRKNNTEVDAPRNLTISGKLGQYKTGTTKWTDDVEVTRFVVAKDAATNELRDQNEVVTNKTRLKVKVLTQATKYDPQVSTQPINVDVTAPGAKISQADFDSMKSNISFDSTRGPVKVDNKTKGLNIEMKDAGAIKQKADGTYYVGATITYPDHSRDEIQIPVVKVDTNVPTATMDDLLLTDNEATTANFVVFKGSKFNPKFKVSDDKNKVTKLSVTGLPNGSTFEQTGDWTSGSKVQVTGDKYITTDTSTLGDHVGTVEVTDSTGNKGTYKYKYKVVDVEVINSPKTVELGTKLVDADNQNNGIDSHGFVKVVDTANASGADKYYPTGMHFKWSKKNVQGTTDEVTTTTELNKPGVVTDYKALVKFPHGAGYYTTNIDGKTVKVYTPASIEKDVTFHVKEQKPAAPTISQWQNGNVKVTPPTDGDKVTIPLANGNVTLVKKDTGWELETPKAGLVFHNGSLEIPKDLVGSNVTAKATKGTGDSAVDSDNATYTPKSHTVTKVDIVKEAGSPLSRDDLSGKTGVTGVVDGTETKDFTAAKIRSVVENSELPKVTPDSKHTIPVTITYEDGSTETTDVIVKVKPQAPTVTPKENGTVEITPILTGEGTTTITYTGEDNTSKTVTLTKAGDGTWTSSDPTIAVDTNGKVTIPADKVKDGSPITAQVTSKLTGLPSQPAKATVGKPLEVAFGKPENAREKAKYTSKVVVTPNKSNSTITAPTVNGLTVNSEGKVTGTPDIKDWDRIEEHRDVTIKVTVTHEGDTPVTKDVIVNVLRDTDGDGDPDITDKDDDNDGIPDEEEKKNGTDPKAPTTQTPTIGITRKENGDAIVTPTKPGGGTYPSGTKVVIPGDNNTTIEVEIGNDGSGTVPNDKLPKGEVSGKGIVKEPNKEPSKPVNVTTPARKPSTIELEQDPKTGDVSVTPKKPDGTLYPENTKVEIPGKDKDHPIIITIGKDGTGKVSNNDLPEGKTPGIGKIIEKGKTPEEVKVETPKRIDPTLPETEAPTDIAITRKENGDAIVTPKKPGGGIYPQGTKVEIPGEDGKTIEVTIGKDGSGEVPNDKLPKEAKPGRGTVTEPNKKPSRPVSVTTPARKTPTVELQQDPDTGEVTVTPKKPDGTLYPENTKVEIPGKDKDHPIIITIGKDGTGKVPNNDLPDGKVPGTSKITVPGKPLVEVPDVTTPSKLIPTVELQQDPDTGEVTVTPKKPDGTLYPENTKVEIPGKDKEHPITITIGKDGTGKVPNNDLPDGEITGTGKITPPGKPSVELEVKTPKKLDPNASQTEQPSGIEITRKPNGDAVVTPKKPDGTTYPSGTKVVIPGDHNTPIEVIIGEDGSGTVPNDSLPKGDIKGKGTVTEPDKRPSNPVDVTTPAKLTPTVELNQDPSTGDVTVTPKRPDGTLYPENTKVEIPGKDKDHPIIITIGKDGKGKVPNDNLPKKDVPGTGKITEPGKPTEEVPNVTTPGKFTPETPVTEKPGEIGITQQPNGNAIVTPKKPDGSTYPPGTKVEIPGENGTTITVTIGDNGSGEVPNDNLPKKDVPGTGTVTEPNKKPSQPVDVTTPARKTPMVELEQDPSTGDVTVTPKKPDGSTYPPGTKVEIPGKDGNPIIVTIGEDGKGKVPNSKLPDGKVPGTGKITEPGQPAVEVPVETPAKVTAENGELPDPITLSELTIEVRWIDENGNVLKPSLKTGNEKDAEHGSIPGYEFVRTMIDENEPVITHIFRKVSGTTNTNPVTPVKPDSNGNSGQDTPAPTPAIPTPNADQVDTKTTMDNGVKSNDSQNVLPNTGTESNAALASLGLLGLLSGFGLVALKKKED